MGMGMGMNRHHRINGKKKISTHSTKKKTFFYQFSFSLMHVINQLPKFQFQVDRSFFGFKIPIQPDDLFIYLDFIIVAKHPCPMSRN